MAQTIRYYKEETTCKNCGRHIKNVVEVDGVAYGTTCCDQFIDSKATVRQIKRTSFNDLMSQQAREDRKAERDALLNYAIAVLPKHFFNMPDSFYQNFLATARTNKLTLGVIAILESRKV